MSTVSRNYFNRAAISSKSAAENGALTALIILTSVLESLSHRSLVGAPPDRTSVMPPANCFTRSSLSDCPIRSVCRRWRIVSTNGRELSEHALDHAEAIPAVRLAIRIIVHSARVGFGARKTRKAPPHSTIADAAKIIIRRDRFMTVVVSLNRSKSLGYMENRRTYSRYGRAGSISPSKKRTSGSVNQSVWRARSVRRRPRLIRAAGLFPTMPGVIASRRGTFQRESYRAWIYL